MRLRLLPLAALACALLATACSNACTELGNRLCKCTPVGTTKAACERTVQADIDRLNPGSSAQAACSRFLETCNAPDDEDFCDWEDGRCGKAACGMSEESIDTLRATPADPTDPACVPDPNVSACPKLCPGP